MDRETNSISLFEIMEQITAIGVPDGAEPGKSNIGNLQFQIVSLWQREKSDPAETKVAPLRVVITPPEGKHHVFNISTVNFKKDYSRVRQVVRFEGMPYGGPGYYEFRVQRGSGTKRISWKTIARLPLEFKIQEAGS